MNSAHWALLTLLLVASVVCGADGKDGHPASPQILGFPFTDETAKAAQESLAKQLKSKIIEENSVGMKMILIPAGEFAVEKYGGLRLLTRPHYLGQTEVTQAQWKAVMGTEIWKGQPRVQTGADYPAAYVTWKDALEFCEKLSKIEGKEYRLPTEVEWEYSCRAGTTTTWSFGKSESDLGEYAWFRDNAWEKGEKYAHQVARKRPNPFGLYDMHGNMWEWCQDVYTVKTYEDPKTQAENPVFGGDSGNRVIRGGSWFSRNDRLSSSYRGTSSLTLRDDALGLRVVMPINSAQKAEAPPAVK